MRASEAQPQAGANYHSLSKKRSALWKNNRLAEEAMITAPFFGMLGALFMKECSNETLAFVDAGAAAGRLFAGRATAYSPAQR
ncbi:hypothetical protein [Oceanimonas sp. GK1]|uniref:hypothetical protein n=1 Tax=Oceanimonas sp. (strain GK1 / IBRC-M 10197) TaxID=511062 RepID=UPI0011D1BC3A|nr:hypothetical protein [Oceanimonas sp. GK1]